MSQAFIGEIRCFGFNFAPLNWAVCNGQTLPISQFSALFSLLGTNFGGDGQTTFSLPDLRSRAPMHWGTGTSGLNTVIAQTMGQETVTLQLSQTPAHTHTVTAAEVGSGGVVERTTAPNVNSWLANSSPEAVWNTSPTFDATFDNAAIGTTGGGQPHDNIQPYLVLNFCIALVGVFPTRN